MFYPNIQNKTSEVLDCEVVALLMPINLEYISTLILNKQGRKKKVAANS